MTIAPVSSSRPPVPAPARSTAAPAGDRFEPGQAQPARKKWTVMVWSASDNNLYAYNLADLDEAEQVGTNPDLNVVAQVDHAPNPDAAGPHDGQRLEIVHDSLPGLHSTVKAELGDVNMASAEGLADFIQWGVKNYPAEHYWLVISDHGDGWKGACEDDSAHGWMSLPMIEDGLRQARQATGQKLDLVSFDCCLMASAEVAHQLKDEARYLVASEQVMGYHGLPYDQVLDRLNLTPEQLCQRLVDLSKLDNQDTQTLSAVDLSRAGQLTSSLKELGQAVLQSGLSGDRLRQVVGQSQDFEGYKDVYDLADRLGQAQESLKAPAERVKAALRSAVLAEQHNDQHPGAHGLQLEVNPDTAASRLRRRALVDQQPWLTRQDRYADTRFAQETGWEAFIAKLNGRS